MREPDGWKAVLKSPEHRPQAYRYYNHTDTTVQLILLNTAGAELQTRVEHGPHAGARTPTACWEKAITDYEVKMVGQTNGAAQGVLLYSVWNFYPAEW